MGGTPKAMKPYFRASWQELKLPHRQSRDDVESWLVVVQNQLGLTEFSGSTNSPLTCSIFDQSSKDCGGIPKYLYEM